MDEKQKLIEDAALMLAGGHAGPAVEIFKGVLWLIDKNNNGSSDRKYDNWIASLELLAQVATAVAKLARAMAKG